MMTVSEAELVRRGAEKGRSASFCAPGQAPPSLSNSHSTQDLSSEGMAAAARASDHTLAFLQTVGQEDTQDIPRARLKTSISTRRSQSCRVQGSRPPRVKRRDKESPKGSGSRTDLNSEPPPHSASQGENLVLGEAEDACYNPFLKKVPSCSRLVILGPGDADVEGEGSPVLRRTSSARRPRQTPSSPNHSPTAARVSRHTQKGRPSSRKATPQGGSRKGYLDVKPSGSAETLDTDAYLLRNFSTTTKGIVNRGDSFRRRQSRSNSVQPQEVIPGPNTSSGSGELPPSPATPELEVTLQVASVSSAAICVSNNFRVAIIGATGVGKTALIHQFRTSECINAYDCVSTGDEQEQPVSIVLDSIESEIVFINVATPEDMENEIQRDPPPSGWVVMYSITDKASFQKAEEELSRLKSINLLKGRAVILVANKCELVRSRAVSTDDGRDLACSYNSKFMEISVGMNHKCDDLLVGILYQLRLKAESTSMDELGGKERNPWTRNRSLMRASKRAKQVINKIIGKTENKYKNCENFQS